MDKVDFVIPNVRLTSPNDPIEGLSREEIIARICNVMMNSDWTPEDWLDSRGFTKGGRMRLGREASRKKMAALTPEDWSGIEKHYENQNEVEDEE